MHPLHELSPGENPPDIINVVVEIPKGSRNKYELHKETGMFKLSRTLYSPMIYPGDYGFIPQTHYLDDDPLDVLVILDEPTRVGCVIHARPIGIFRMLDQSQHDDKILCVPATNPRFRHWQDIDDMSEHAQDEIAHFFATYKDLEGTSVRGLGWKGAKNAKRQIELALELYREKYAKAGPAAFCP
ncbi:MAG: inorganic diphosphatase [Sumerlaeia bacterium]